VRRQGFNSNSVSIVRDASENQTCAVQDTNAVVLSNVTFCISVTSSANRAHAFCRFMKEKLFWVE